MAETKTTYFLHPIGLVFKKEVDEGTTKYYSWNVKSRGWKEDNTIDCYFSGMEDGRFVSEDKAKSAIAELERKNA